MLKVVPINIDKGEQDQQRMIQRVPEEVVRVVVIEHLIQKGLDLFDRVGFSWVHEACYQGGGVVA